MKKRANPRKPEVPSSEPGLGNSSGLTEFSRFLDDIRVPAFVKASLDRAGFAGLEVTPAER